MIDHQMKKFASTVHLGHNLFFHLEWWEEFREQNQQNYLFGHLKVRCVSHAVSLWRVFPSVCDVTTTLRNPDNREPAASDSIAPRSFQSAVTRGGCGHVSSYEFNDHMNCWYNHKIIFVSGPLESVGVSGCHSSQVSPWIIAGMLHDISTSRDIDPTCLS